MGFLNIEDRRRYQREWRQANPTPPEKNRVYSLNYYNRNKDQINAARREKRRQKRLEATQNDLEEVPENSTIDLGVA